MENKSCTRCKKSKSIENFPFRKGNSGLRQSWCRECKLQYQRDKRTTETRTCKYCDNPLQAKELCQGHLSRLRAHGEVYPDIPLGKLKEPKGWINKHGYKLISMPQHPNSYKSGQLLEHVLVMSEYIGRPLLPHENVHHKNGVRDDNRLENLELWSTSQPSGQRVEDKLEWALDIIRVYKPELLCSPEN